MKILRQTRGDGDKVVGITTVEEWFTTDDKRIHPIYKDFFVVAKWTQYQGDYGMESRCTIAITESQEDAELIYQEHCKKLKPIYDGSVSE